MRSAWTRVEKSNPVNPNDEAGVGSGDARPSGVVTAPAIRIDQRLVGVEHLPEANRGLAVARVDVRMPAAREASIGALDVALAGLPLNAEHNVKVHDRVSEC